MSQQILWIRNGRVIDPISGRDAVGDVFAIDGKFVEGLDELQKRAAETVDATGLVVCPGLVDIHVHFREPGQTHKEDIASGSRCAAAGGFTTVVCMPNTTPVADNPGTIQRMLDSIRSKAVVKVHTTGCLSVGMEGKQLAPMGSLKAAGVVALTDDGRCIQDNELMRRAVEYSHMLGLVVMDHCQDSAMTAGAVMHEGHWSLRLGLKGWPAAAEDLIIGRNILLAEHFGARIHMQHCSTAGGIELLRRARARGVPVSGEATPHHVYFTDADCAGYDTNFKMNPPLRSAADREALIAGVLDGTIDIIATDHAPHTDYEKDQEFDLAPFGITGLEVALATMLEVFIHGGRCDLPFLLARMTHKPAELLGLDAGTLRTGADADLCLFDPDESWTVDRFQTCSKSTNNPWHGRTLRGRVKRTLVRGRTVWST